MTEHFVELHGERVPVVPEFPGQAKLIEAFLGFAAFK
ncbi:hypothetical protein KIPB_014453, partial [Kipferlia bialata]|eukprot:g14453.t1